MSVGKFCNREVVVTQRDSPVAEVARLMRDFHVGDLVVVDDANAPVPIGIVTDRDLVVEVLAKEVAPETVTAGDVMSLELITARDSDGLSDTLQRMRSRGIRRVPVIDEGGRLVGIISAEDILELLAEELSALAFISSREREHERRLRH